MAAPVTPTRLRHDPSSREVRIRFGTRPSLLAGFARAQRESWIEDCHVDLARLELVVRMAGGFRAQPPRPAPLEVLDGGRR